MQDYDGPAGYHPLIGEGMWPDRYVNTMFVVFLLGVIILCALAYRLGQNAMRRSHLSGRNKAPELIFTAIRDRLNRALYQTGEHIVGPAEEVVATAELYLGPVLVFCAGFGSMFQALRKALNTYSVEDVQGHAPAAVVPNQPGIGPFIFVTPPGGVTASATATAGAPAGGNVQVLTSPPADHGSGHSDHGGHGHGHGHKRDLSPKERARAIREAIETLSDYWQKDRVEGQIKAMQECLLIEKRRETTPPPPRPAARPRPAPTSGSRSPFSFLKF